MIYDKETIVDSLEKIFKPGMFILAHDKGHFARYYCIRLKNNMVVWYEIGTSRKVASGDFKSSRQIIELNMLTKYDSGSMYVDYTIEREVNLICQK